MIYRILADAVLVFHLCFVLFAVLGGLLVLRWRPFVFLHIPAVIWGVLVECFHWTCPLTPLENRFRHLGGEAGYDGGFIEHYTSLILYADISHGLQTALGLGLLVVNLLVYSYVFMRQQKAARSDYLTAPPKIS